MDWGRLALLVLALGVLPISCAVPLPPGSDLAGLAASPSKPAARVRGEGRDALKRITIGVLREPDARPTAEGPARVIQPLINSGLTISDPRRMRHPVLAEVVPSIENGLWKLLPDGRMETIWKLRKGARWHDGVPFSAQDVLFTLEMGRDGRLSGFGSVVYAAIDDVTAVDPSTLAISWKQPHIDADALLDLSPLGPLPGHRLASAFRDDPTGALDLPYWTQDYVGTGPFRIREWVPGLGVRLEANGDHVLGRPKVDEIEVRYVPDSNTLTANLLAGAVDITNNVGSVDLGLQLREQWRHGEVAFNFGSSLWVAMFPQLVDPRPAIVADLRFRRALLHAVDRQEILDTFVGGMSPVPHSFLNPNQPQYREIEASLARYEYDPRRAAQLLQDLGYAKDSDGMYYGAPGEPLSIELRSGPADAVAKPAMAFAGHWQRFGVAATAVPLSPQRVQDFEYIATFPAFTVMTRINDLAGLRFLHSSQTRLPSNGFRVAGAGNTSRYMNSEFDALLDTYFRTVPWAERTAVLGQIIHHIAEEATAIGLYYNPVAGAISNRVRNVPYEWPGALISWNAHEWDIKS